MHLLLRADSDASIGAGHVMRCLALGRRWIAAGGTATVVGRIDGERLRERIFDAGLELQPLTASHPDAADLTQTLATLERLRSAGDAWVAVDGYHFDERYHSAIRRRGFPLLLIDDLADRRRYHADVVLNQNLGAEQLSYHTDDDTRLLLGARYTMLQPEFERWRDSRRDVPVVARRILVTVGGGDPHGATALIVAALDHVDIDGLEVTVVSGPAARGAARSAAAASRHRCHVVEDVRDMAALMAAVDVAVTGGGSTCWELAFLGLPAIVIELSDNQERSARAIAAAGAVENAGAVRDQQPAALGARIAALCIDAARRGAMSAAGRALIDGRGADRVIGRLGLGLPRLTLRRANEADARAIWQLANEPSVREQSFNASPIPWESHQAWMTRVLSSPTNRMWVWSADTGLAGQVRYEASDGEAEIGISVAPAFRGFGLAARLLALTWADACRELGVPRARGVVFMSNRSSAAAFREAGFIETGAPRDIRGHLCHVFTRRLES
jgi:UDP-2,4-diacetamido-2,4,6-trideoxy-beta-L-altropyranose hydrolase